MATSKDDLVSQYYSISSQRFENPALDWGDSPLHFLARYHVVEGLALALTAYGDINVRNNFGQTPLIAATHSVFIWEGPLAGFAKTIEMLTDKSDRTAKDILGWTALQYLLFNLVGIYGVSDESKDGYAGKVTVDRSLITKMKLIKSLAKGSEDNLREIIAMPIFQESLQLQHAQYSEFIKSL